MPLRSGPENRTKDIFTLHKPFLEMPLWSQGIIFRMNAVEQLFIFREKFKHLDNLMDYQVNFDSKIMYNFFLLVFNDIIHLH